MQTAPPITIETEWLKLQIIKKNFRNIKITIKCYPSLTKHRKVNKKLMQININQKAQIVPIVTIKATNKIGLKAKKIEVTCLSLHVIAKETRTIN